MRVTRDIRGYIIRNTIEQVFSLKKEALAIESNAIAELIYSKLYPPEIVHQMGKLPHEFFYEVSKIYIRFGIQPRQEFDLISSKPVAARDREYKKPCLELPQEKEYALYTRIENFIKFKEKMDLDINALRDKLQRLLKGINTIKQLEAEWPDGAAYYKDYVPPVPLKNVPAVRGQDVSNFILTLGE